jgi:hypothetical protein
VSSCPRFNRPRGKRAGQRRDPHSRVERLRQAADGPVTQEHVRRPDCRDNELSPSTRKASSEPPRVFFGCKTCGGCGWLPACGIEMVDPYLRRESA